MLVVQSCFWSLLTIEIMTILHQKLLGDFLEKLLLFSFKLLSRLVFHFIFSMLTSYLSSHRIQHAIAWMLWSFCPLQTYRLWQCSNEYEFLVASFLPPWWCDLLTPLEVASDNQNCYFASIARNTFSFDYFVIDLCVMRFNCMNGDNLDRHCIKRMNEGQKCCIWREQLKARKGQQRLIRV